MKAAVWHGKRDVQIEQVPEPGQAGPGHAIVKIALTGICGTDLHEYTDGPQYIPAGTQAQTLGHEMSGTVVDIGQGVTRAKVGDRVAVHAIRTCGKCRMCLKNIPALCANFKA